MRIDFLAKFSKKDLTVASGWVEGIASDKSERFFARPKLNGPGGENLLG